MAATLPFQSNTHFSNWPTWSQHNDQHEPRLHPQTWMLQHCWTFSMCVTQPPIYCMLCLRHLWCYELCTVAIVPISLHLCYFLTCHCFQYSAARKSNCILTSKIVFHMEPICNLFWWKFINFWHVLFGEQTIFGTNIRSNNFSPIILKNIR